MDAVAIGETQPSGQLVTVSMEDRYRHFYIVGVNGSGKSTLILNMALQDIAAGRGIFVLDPKGDLVHDLLSLIPAARLDDVLLLDPLHTACPFAINILECDDPQDTDLVETILGRAM